MAKVMIRYATPEDVHFVAGHLRTSDVIEIRLSQPDSPEEAVLISFKHSTWTKCALVDGVPTVLYGVSPTEMPNCGTPWMLATDDILKIKKEFLAGCMAEIDEMLMHYRFLANQVHKENIVSIGWLKKLGFTVDPTPTGPFNEFFNFWMGQLQGVTHA